MHPRATRPTTRPAAPLVLAASFVAVGSIALSACGAGAPTAPGAVAATQQAATSTTTAPPPLVLTAASPPAGAALPSTNAPITLTLSAPLSASSPDPVLTPPTAGTWSRAGSTLTFTPSGEYAPFTPLAVTLAAGARGADGQTAQPALAVTYTTPQPTVRRYQQLLAQLAYLPVSFTAAVPAAPGTVAVADQAGAFAWRWPNVPAGLAAGWAEGQAGLVTKGAVMAFEADHHLTIDGIAGPSVWAALVAAVKAGQVDPRPYDYITVSQARPETLTVWQDGANVYSSLANTGVPGALTDRGTFPVYERFTVTTMSGKNPDGSTYHDPGIPWVAYFNGGDAIHGFVRPGYGYPQSDGCVELPPDHAQAVYPMDFYGTLVTVQ